MRKQGQEGRRLVVMTQTVFKLKCNLTLSWCFVLLCFPLTESTVGLTILFWFEKYRSKLKNGSLMQSLWRIIMRFLKKPIMSVAIGSSNPTPQCTSGENSNLKKYMHSNVHCSIICNNKTRKQHNGHQ